MKTAEYIAVAKTQIGQSSDYALAKSLGTDASTVAHWTKGRSVPDNRFAVKLADILELDPMEVLANIEIERAERKGALEAAEFWRDRLRRLSTGVKKQAAKGIGTALTCLLAGSILITPDPVNASSISLAKPAITQEPPLYIM